MNKESKRIRDNVMDNIKNLSALPEKALKGSENYANTIENNFSKYSIKTVGRIGALLLIVFAMAGTLANLVYLFSGILFATYRKKNNQETIRHADTEESRVAIDNSEVTGSPVAKDDCRIYSEKVEGFRLKTSADDLRSSGFWDLSEWEVPDDQPALHVRDSETEEVPDEQEEAVNRPSLN